MSEVIFCERCKLWFYYDSIKHQCQTKFEYDVPPQSPDLLATAILAKEPSLGGPPTNGNEYAVEPPVVMTSDQAFQGFY